VTQSRRGSIVIVGGGASGVSLAAHLLQSPSSSLRVTLVEKRPEFGSGLAYSTSLPDHLLNVTDKGMSALAHDPEHFSRWARERGFVQGNEPYYAPRSLYGRYLRELLSELAEREPVRLRLVQEEAVSITPSGSGVEVSLANGASLVGHVTVLATGHDDQPEADLAFAIKTEFVDSGGIDRTAPVLILGTGLSMVDAVLLLEARGHTGQIVAVSRRGLIPSPHRPGSPIRLDSADIPLGTDLSYFLSWFRQLVRDTEARGGDWRDVVDGLRPFNQRIWQSWSTSTRRRFIEHTKAWWDVHRHRMAPQIHARLQETIASGRLRLVAGRLADVTSEGDSFRVTLEHRQTRHAETLSVAAILDCTGIAKDVSASSIRIVRGLIRQRLARPDPMRIGLDVTTDCAVVDADGRPSSNIYAVGPLTRGTFLEIDAMPDIRAQCARLANLLTA